MLSDVWIVRSVWGLLNGAEASVVAVSDEPESLGIVFSIVYGTFVVALSTAGKRVLCSNTGLKFG